ncbi:hypothetical protein [Ornithinibacillus bavariensis]|uniref:Uncharacterized protein n=1 Tax=Ornithinibacillus bavariensis TaxID=545502 RepID=A0A919X806_9BACI|nr:hypothetical protein [Ornithinibacillus bavariensis]GIO25803.1 hypothetical protein J43TS3_04140 [Ornithinibacillus bavariensis]HAM79785.1 hypothetical protein [Ornithinibacillus sp.]
MSVEYYHGLCNRYRGRAVKIVTRDGRVHRGIIHRVDGRRVYLRPIDGARNLGGYGYGFFGGFGYGLALGAITSIALLPFFFW